MVDFIRRLGLWLSLWIASGSTANETLEDWDGRQF